MADSINKTINKTELEYGTSRIHTIKHVKSSKNYEWKSLETLNL